MVSVPVQCPYCQNTEVIKAGKQANGTQRYRCQNARCARRIFLLQYQDLGRIPEVRRQVVDMALNGSGIRDTARVLRISPTTVITVLKKMYGLPVRVNRVPVREQRETTDCGNVSGFCRGLPQSRALMGRANSRTL